MSVFTLVSGTVLLVVAIAFLGFLLGRITCQNSEVLGANSYALVNSSRSAAGLPALKQSSQLASYAKKHSQEMANAKDLYHSSSSELKRAAGSGWSKLGENVGKGGSVSSLHDAFMASPSHKANILGDYTHVGIGVVIQDGVTYETQVFAHYGTPTTTTTSSTIGTAAAPTTTTTTLKAVTTVPRTTTTEKCP